MGAEFLPVLDLYKLIQPREVLEVGTYHGGTLYHWLQNAQKPATVVSVDCYAVGVDNRALYPSWVRDGVELVTIMGDSSAQRTIDAAAERAPYDWVFIDAGHYYDEVLRDWQNYEPLAGSPSVILFHDILPPTRAHPEIEVAQLWSEIRGQGWNTLEVVQDRGAEWGGIGIVLK